MALFAIAFIFLTHCFLQCRDSVLIRPHPGVWRVVHGIGMLYLMCLGVVMGEARREEGQGKEGGREGGRERAGKGRGWGRIDFIDGLCLSTPFPS
jgi:threonine/homoserine/homoserine lactone efflux protein